MKDCIRRAVTKKIRATGCFSICLLLFMLASSFYGPLCAENTTAEDMKLGPFRCGQVWDENPAKKHFGPLLQKTRIKIEDKDNFQFNRYGITVTAEKNTEGKDIADQFKYRDISFFVVDGKIRLISMTGTETPTARGIKIGDSYEKVKKFYPVSQELDTKVQEWTADRSDPAFHLYFSYNQGGWHDRHYLFFDKSTKTVNGIGYSRSRQPEYEYTVKPIDKSDFQIGKFTCQNRWDAKLARKYFGKPVKTSMFKIDAHQPVRFYENGHLRNVEQGVHDTVPAQYHYFQKAAFVLVDSHIRSIYIYNSDMRKIKNLKLLTPRKIGIGDTFEKLKRTYPVTTRMADEFDSHLKDHSASNVYIYFYSIENGKRRQLTFFIDKQSLKITGIALTVSDLSPTER